MAHKKLAQKLPHGAVRQTLILAFTLFFIKEATSDKKVVCYYTNWSVYRPGTAKFNPQNINPYLCTHLIYAFGGFTKDNTLKAFDKYQDLEQGGYAKFTGLKTYNKNLKTLLAIGGWNEGSSRFSPLVANPERRHQFIKNILKFLRQNHFDGLDLDWEYPGHRDGGKPRDKENYALFVQELRAEFDRESAKTGRPRLLLTMAVPAGIEYIEKGYDIPKLNKYLDWFNILSYDYHSAYEPSVNHHAPLYPLEEEDDEYNFDGELNIDYTVKHYLKAGADRDKLVLGIPTYGRSYTLINEDSTDIGSPSDGPGEQGDATREKGYLAYYEICQNIKSDEDWNVVQPNPRSMGPFAFKRNQWVGYDDEAIVKKKGEYVVNKGLGGIMFWSIDNDDFRGNCNGRPYPLIEAAKEAMLDKLGYSDNEVIKPDKIRKPGRSRSQNDSSTRKKVSTNNAEENKFQNTLKRPGGRKRISTTSTTTTTTLNPASSLGRRTTPSPPTTPDPGTDFKCEDEGFFSHPRDCKKYYWCLDSGPSNLGIIAHQFTCPSGLYFNPAADSCDFTRNVLCKNNNKASSTTKGTTITTTTKSTTTTLASPSKTLRIKTTTTTPEPEYEEYEDENEDEIENAQEGEEKLTVKDPEEDPKVIKELIDLIKKVGGIKELEKLLQQDDQGGDDETKQIKNSEKSTLQRTFANKSLYSKVLGRENSLTTLKDRFSTLQAFQRNSKSSDRTEDYGDNNPNGKYSSVVRNSRPRPQNDGLQELAEFEGFLREKPKYVTLNRSRPTQSKIIETKDNNDNDGDKKEDKDDNNDEDDDEEEDNIFRYKITSENPLSSSTISYVNIRRTLPSSTTVIPNIDKMDSTTELKTDDFKTKSPPSFIRNRYKTIVRSNTQNISNQDENVEEETPNVTVINTENNEFTQAPKRNLVTYFETERRTTTSATQTDQPAVQQDSTTISYIKHTNSKNIFAHTHNITTTESISSIITHEPITEIPSYAISNLTEKSSFSISTTADVNIDITESPKLIHLEKLNKMKDEIIETSTDKTNEKNLLNFANEVNLSNDNTTIFNSTETGSSNIKNLEDSSHSNINLIHNNDGESSSTKTITESTYKDENTTPFLGTVSSPRPFSPIHKRIRIVRPANKNSPNGTSILENSSSSSVIDVNNNNKKNDVTINKVSSVKLNRYINSSIRSSSNLEDSNAKNVDIDKLSTVNTTQSKLDFSGKNKIKLNSIRVKKFNISEDNNDYNRDISSLSTTNNLESNTKKTEVSNSTNNFNNLRNFSAGDIGKFKLTLKSQISLYDEKNSKNINESESTEASPYFKNTVSKQEIESVVLKVQESHQSRRKNFLRRNTSKYSSPTTDTITESAINAKIQNDSVPSKISKKCKKRIIERQPNINQDIDIEQFENSKAYSWRDARIANFRPWKTTTSIPNLYDSTTEAVKIKFVYEDCMDDNESDDSTSRHNGDNKSSVEKHQENKLTEKETKLISKTKFNINLNKQINTRPIQFISSNQINKRYQNLNREHTNKKELNETQNNDETRIGDETQDNNSKSIIVDESNNFSSQSEFKKKNINSRPTESTDPFNKSYQYINREKLVKEELNETKSNDDTQIGDQTPDNNSKSIVVDEKNNASSESEFKKKQINSMSTEFTDRFNKRYQNINREHTDKNELNETKNNDDSQISDNGQDNNSKGIIVDGSNITHSQGKFENDVFFSENTGNFAINISEIKIEGNEKNNTDETSTKTNEQIVSSVKNVTLGNQANPPNTSILIENSTVEFSNQHTRVPFHRFPLSTKFHTDNTITKSASQSGNNILNDVSENENRDSESYNENIKILFNTTDSKIAQDIINQVNITNQEQIDTIDNPLETESSKFETNENERKIVLQRTFIKPRRKFSTVENKTEHEDVDENNERKINNKIKKIVNGNRQDINFTSNRGKQEQANDVEKHRGHLISDQEEKISDQTSYDTSYKDNKEVGSLEKPFNTQSNYDNQRKTKSKNNFENRSRFAKVLETSNLENDEYDKQTEDDYNERSINKQPERKYRPKLTADELSSLLAVDLRKYKKGNTQIFNESNPSPRRRRPTQRTEISTSTVKPHIRRIPVITTEIPEKEYEYSEKLIKRVQTISPVSRSFNRTRLFQSQTKNNVRNKTSEEEEIKSFTSNVRDKHKSYQTDNIKSNNYKNNNNSDKNENEDYNNNNDFYVDDDDGDDNNEDNNNDKSIENNKDVTNKNVSNDFNRRYSGNLLKKLSDQERGKETSNPTNSQQTNSSTTQNDTAQLTNESTVTNGRPFNKIFLRNRIKINSTVVVGDQELTNSDRISTMSGSEIKTNNQTRISSTRRVFLRKKLKENITIKKLTTNNSTTTDEENDPDDLLTTHSSENKINQKRIIPTRRTFLKRKQNESSTVKEVTTIISVNTDKDNEYENFVTTLNPDIDLSSQTRRTPIRRVFLRKKQNENSTIEEVTTNSPETTNVDNESDDLLTTPGPEINLNNQTRRTPIRRVFLKKKPSENSTTDEVTTNNPATTNDGNKADDLLTTPGPEINLNSQTRRTLIRRVFLRKKQNENSTNEEVTTNIPETTNVDNESDDLLTTPGPEINLNGQSPRSPIRHVFLRKKQNENSTIEELATNSTATANEDNEFNDLLATPGPEIHLNSQIRRTPIRRVFLRKKPSENSTTEEVTTNNSATTNDGNKADDLLTTPGPEINLNSQTRRTPIRRVFSRKKQNENSTIEEVATNSPEATNVDNESDDLLTTPGPEINLNDQPTRFQNSNNEQFTTNSSTTIDGDNESVSSLATPDSVVNLNSQTGRTSTRRVLLRSKQTQNLAIEEITTSGPATVKDDNEFENLLTTSGPEINLNSQTRRNPIRRVLLRTKQNQNSTSQELTTNNSTTIDGDIESNNLFTGPEIKINNQTRIFPTRRIFSRKKQNKNLPNEEVTINNSTAIDGDSEADNSLTRPGPDINLNSQTRQTPTRRVFLRRKQKQNLTINNSEEVTNNLPAIVIAKNENYVQSTLAPLRKSFLKNKFKNNIENTQEDEDSSEGSITSSENKHKDFGTTFGQVRLENSKFRPTFRPKINLTLKPKNDIVEIARENVEINVSREKPKYSFVRIKSTEAPSSETQTEAKEFTTTESPEATTYKYDFINLNRNKSIVATTFISAEKNETETEEIDDNATQTDDKIKITTIHPIFNRKYTSIERGKITNLENLKALNGSKKIETDNDENENGNENEDDDDDNDNDDDDNDEDDDDDDDDDNDDGDDDDDDHDEQDYNNEKEKLDKNIENEGKVIINNETKNSLESHIENRVNQTEISTFKKKFNRPPYQILNRQKAKDFQNQIDYKTELADRNESAKQPISYRNRFKSLELSNKENVQQNNTNNQNYTNLQLAQLCDKHNSSNCVESSKNNNTFIDKFSSTNKTDILGNDVNQKIFFLNVNRRFQTNSNGTDSIDAKSNEDYESTTKQINGRRLRILKFKRPVTNAIEDKLNIKSNSTQTVETKSLDKIENLDSTTKTQLRKKVFIRKRPLTTTTPTETNITELENEKTRTENETEGIAIRGLNKHIKFVKKIILRNETVAHKQNDSHENISLELSQNIKDVADKAILEESVLLQNTSENLITNSRGKIYLNRRPSRPTKSSATLSTTKALDLPILDQDSNASLNISNSNRGKSSFRSGYVNIRRGNTTVEADENEQKKQNEPNYKTIARTNLLNRKFSDERLAKGNETVLNNKDDNVDEDENEDANDEDDDDDEDVDDNDDNDEYDENIDNDEEENKNEKQKKNENITQRNLGVSNNLDSNLFKSRTKTNFQNHTNRKQNIPVGINRNITTKKSNRFRINRPNNIPKIKNRKFVTTTPHPISNQISVTTTFPLTTPSIFKSTNTKLRKYTTVTSTTEPTQKDDLLLDLNVNALNARNKKIFEITSKKHTTVKPKSKEQISILDNESNILNVNETQTTETETSEISDKNVKSYLNNDLNNFQETTLENSVQEPTSSTEQPLTTTHKATTVSHVFSTNNTDEISTTEVSDADKDFSTTIENEEKLVEINRVVEVSSKENKLKLKSIGIDLDNIKTTNVKLVEPPHIDKLGEISRVKYVTLVESGEEYPTTKSYNEVYNENVKYYDNILNESEKRGRQLILPEVIRGIETSTIPLEGLFKTFRKSKSNDIQYNSPVYALSLGEAYVTSKPDIDNDVLYEDQEKTVDKKTIGKIEDIEITTSPFLSDTTTVQPDKTTNYIRPIVPLLRPESNESSPLVISIANLDKSKITLRQNSRPLLNLRNRSTTSPTLFTEVSSVTAATTPLSKGFKYSYRTTTERSQTTDSIDESNSTTRATQRTIVSRRKFLRPSNSSETKKLTRTTTILTTKDLPEISTSRPRNQLFRRKYFTTTATTTTIQIPNTTKLPGTSTDSTISFFKDTDQEAGSSIQDKKILNNKINYFNSVDDIGKERDNKLVEVIKAISQAPIPISISSSLGLNFPNSIQINGNDDINISTHLPHKSMINQDLSARKHIRTTIKVKTTTQPSTTTEIIRKRRPTKTRQPFDKVTNKQKFSPENIYHPITDYDYYDDDDVKVIGKSNSQVKVILHGRGLIECLDQGNFPHPLSCRKFISCAKMETGGVVGWEYTCPKNLSYDPVGGICNWAAGLGCKD